MWWKGYFFYVNASDVTGEIIFFDAEDIREIGKLGSFVVDIEDSDADLSSARQTPIVFSFDCQCVSTELFAINRSINEKASVRFSNHKMAQFVTSDYWIRHLIIFLILGLKRKGESSLLSKFRVNFQAQSSMQTWKVCTSERTGAPSWTKTSNEFCANTGAFKFGPAVMITSMTPSDDFPPLSVTCVQISMTIKLKNRQLEFPAGFGNNGIVYL